MSQLNISIRPLVSIEEFRQAEQLQDYVWGFSPRETVPLHLLITAQKNAGLVLGAFDTDRDLLVGMLFGFLGRSIEGREKHCSHMMGILPEYQSQGIGNRLKFVQRELVIAQGIDLITWTYDPLETRNGYLNIHVLGTLCNTYLPNAYGEVQDSLNKGVSTDRFQVDWWLRSERVSARADAYAGHPSPYLQRQHRLEAPPEHQINQVLYDDRGLPVPRDSWQAYWHHYPETTWWLETPMYFQQLKQQDLGLARAWREHSRAIFEEAFQEGYRVVDALRWPEAERFYYLLKPVKIQELEHELHDVGTESPL